MRKKQSRASMECGPLVIYMAEHCVSMHYSSKEEDESLWCHADTLHCIRRGCIPCAYKLCVYGGPFAKSNIRPELCPRFASPISTTHDITHKGLYYKEHSIMTVGDGNFSFSLCLCEALAPVSLTATSYESYESLLTAYPDAEKNINILRENGVRVEHGIDAGSECCICFLYIYIRILNLNVAFVELQAYTSTFTKPVDVIVWNFPCIANKEGADAQNVDIEENKVCELPYVCLCRYLVTKLFLCRNSSLLFFLLPHLSYHQQERYM
jgi:hypothetical protein